MLTVTVDNLTKNYRKHAALTGVTLELSPGITSILGRNGAGKSTLSKIIVGIERSSAGSVVTRRGDSVLEGRTRQAVVGWLPQSFGYPTQMKLEGFVAYAAWLKGVDDDALAARVDDAITTVGLDDSRAQRLGHLSGGMLRRAGLAAAIVHKPELLVLDEPTAGLDPVQRGDFHERIRHLAQSSSVLMATHLLEDVQAMSSAISVLDRGRVVWSGTTGELAALGGGGEASVDALRSGLLRLVGDE